MFFCSESAVIHSLAWHICLRCSLSPFSRPNHDKTVQQKPISKLILQAFRPWNSWRRCDLGMEVKLPILTIGRITQHHTLSMISSYDLGYEVWVPGFFGPKFHFIPDSKSNRGSEAPTGDRRHYTTCLLAERSSPIYAHYHRIGWWENLQETPIFDRKNHGFL